MTSRISLSSWSLHRRLGPAWHYLPGETIRPERETPWGDGEISLLDVPAELKAHGIGALEICSFHLPSIEQTYLEELKSALAESGITLQTLLIEAGDPSDPETGERDVTFMRDWVERAAGLEAKFARVIAGKQEPTPANLQRAADHLNWLGENASDLPVRVVTENWFSLLSGPDQTNWLLDQLGDRIGLNGDLGNWRSDSKYDDLAQIMGRAEICHCKADFVDGVLDENDYRQAISVSEDAGYTGPYTLIFDNDAPDEWEGIEIEKKFVEDMLAVRG